MRLFHVSSDPGITVFDPRPSPSEFSALRGDVVFGIEERLLHNYLLPRDCPRVGFYAGPATSAADVDRFLTGVSSCYVLGIEGRWLRQKTDAVPGILGDRIYVYELPVEGFELLDACAGYYVCYDAVRPLGMEVIDDIPAALIARGVELRIMPSLWPLADAVKGSTLQFSLIRMRNAYCG